MCQMVKAENRNCRRKLGRIIECKDLIKYKAAGKLYSRRVRVITVIA